ncbi:hypothetical protein DRQ25_13550 [Candidatus Fermentibacteria bacterium]|nr:MAG: hypothetical protein DRQ25_13550 [Candidatus Fermentibacteria bacterium]
MCANAILFLFAVLGTVQLSAPIEELPFSDFEYITVPGGIIDAEINGDGDIYVLLPGLPHLRVYEADGSLSEYDLPDVLLPGGMCIDERWGWFVTDELRDTVYRYDNTGEPADIWSSRGMPGDICLSGLSVLYVSKASGTVTSLEEPDDILLRLTGSGEGQLTASGSEAVYSCENESLLFRNYTVPESLPSAGIWVAAGGELIVLQDSCVLGGSGSVLFRLPEAGEFSRISCSVNSNHCLLWSPGRGRILVLR